MEKNMWIGKGWGGEYVIINCDKYCGKILNFIKGRKNSVHKHLLKQETFYVQKGQIQLNLYFYENLEHFGTVILDEGDSYTIEPNQIHNILALKGSEIFEFSSKHSDEDTIKLIPGD